MDLAQRTTASLLRLPKGHDRSLAQLDGGDERLLSKFLTAERRLKKHDGRSYARYEVLVGSRGEYAAPVQFLIAQKSKMEGLERAVEMLKLAVPDLDQDFNLKTFAKSHSYDELLFPAIVAHARHLVIDPLDAAKRQDVYRNIFPNKDEFLWCGYGKLLTRVRIATFLSNVGFSLSTRSIAKPSLNVGPILNIVPDSKKVQTFMRDEINYLNAYAEKCYP